uniref:ATP synthase F0 subunit 8 n=1 Tax=Goera martynowi TaxID=3399597 RepID=UPI0022DCDDC6|nr:ATP synthase F0 subunit 8 [Goera horni]UZZ43964.1 ATP synthase F0 subunit 8 [Goera horni]
MPQMMPLNWTLMLILFNLIFLFFLIMNYYNYKYNYQSKKMMSKNNIKFIHNFWSFN